MVFLIWLYIGFWSQPITSGAFIVIVSTSLNPEDSMHDNNKHFFNAPDAALKGVALSSVNECLNYDLPSNFNVFERKWERFLLSERQTDFKMNILVDRSNILSWEEEVLKIADKYIEPQNDL